MGRRRRAHHGASEPKGGLAVGPGRSKRRRNVEARFLQRSDRGRSRSFTGTSRLASRSRNARDLASSAVSSAWRSCFCCDLQRDGLAVDVLLRAVEVLLEEVAWHEAVAESFDEVERSVESASADGASPSAACAAARRPSASMHDASSPLQRSTALVAAARASCRPVHLGIGEREHLLAPAREGIQRRARAPARAHWRRARTRRW